MVGTTGVGGASHLAGVLFANTTGTSIQIVPYRGAAPRMQDLLVGSDPPGVRPGLERACAGARPATCTAFAVTSKTRLGVAPDIPTVDEAGLPGFHMSVWHGLWASEGHAGRRDRASSMPRSWTRSPTPTVRQRLADLGQELPARERLTPEALGAYQKAEIEKWWPIVKAAGIKVD